MTPFKQGCMNHSDTVEQGVEGMVILLGSFAYPILFLCIFLSLAEPALHTPDLYNLIVMLVQAFGLDLGGSALVMRGLTMRKTVGHEKVGKRTVVIGGIIIGLTVLSLAFIVVPQIYPDAAEFSKKADSILMLVRVVGSAAYGFILHLVKGMDVEVQPTPSQPQQPTPQHTELEKKLTALMETVSELSKKIDAAPQVDVAVEARRIIIEEIRAIVPQIVAPSVSLPVSPLPAQNETVVSSLVSPEDMFQETDYDEPVSLSVSQKPRITIKLNETRTKHERNTDKLRQVSAVSSAVSQKKVSGETEVITKMRRIVKRNTNIDPAELAQRAGVTPQYARRIKSRIIAELTTV